MKQEKEYKMSDYDIEAQFLKYCEMSNLPLDKMHAVQLVETRRAFYGAGGQMLLLLRDGVSELQEMVGVVICERMLNQIELF